MIAQLKRCALGFLRLAHIILAAANLNLVQSAVMVLVIGAAVYAALDAGIGLIVHNVLLLVFGIQGEYAPATSALFF